MRDIGLPNIGGTSPVRGVAPVERVAPAQKSAGQAQEAEALVSITKPSAGDAPVDAERVSEIRKAIEDGRYPLVPTEIADGIIAAGLFHIVGK